MRTIIAADKAYNKKDIIDRASQIEISKTSRGAVITKDNGNVVSTYTPTEHYEIVQFSDAVETLLEVIGRIFKPEFYTINIKAGFQELKLRGSEHIVNGEVFHEMIWLTNSSNGSKRLSIRYGLMRQICSNGLCISLAGATFKVKHLTSNNVNVELKKFMRELPEMNVTRQVETLKKIAGKQIAVKDVIRGLNPKNEVVETSVWNDLVNKFGSSKTDAIGTKDDALITGLKVPVKDMPKETLDTPLDSWKVLQCFTELFRSADASTIELQTTKIVDVLTAVN